MVAQRLTRCSHVLLPSAESGRDFPAPNADATSKVPSYRTGTKQRGRGTTRPHRGARSHRLVPILCVTMAGALIAVSTVCYHLRTLDSLGGTGIAPVPAKPPLVGQYRTENTVVTAYYPMQSKRSDRTYRHWMRNFLSLSDAMVIFTVKEMFPVIAEMRGERRMKERTTLIEASLEDSMVAKRYGLDFWRGQLDKDPEKQIHRSHELFLVWHNKLDFLRTAARRNPYQSKFFAWVDIGYLRNHQYNNQEMLHSIPLATKEDQMLMLDTSRLVRKKVPCIGGGFLGGHSRAIHTFHQNYYSVLDKQSASGHFVGKDQPFFHKTCVQEPGICRIVLPRVGYGDDWFFMTPYLSKRYSKTLQSQLRKVPKGGGLGSLIFEYASTIGISFHNGMQPCMTAGVEVNQLRKLFVGPINECDEERRLASQQRAIWSEEEQYAKHHEFLRRRENSRDEHSIQLEGFLQSYKYWADRYWFEKFLAGNGRAELEVMSTLRLRDSYLQNATKFLRPYQNSTIVGVHVQRGGTLNQDGAYLRVPSNSFYKRAIEYMRNKHTSFWSARQSLTFVVASEDVGWCQKLPAFQSEDVVFIETGDPSDDFAILTQTDHFVLGAGTFGWWGAYLGAHQRGGDVVYFDGVFNMSHAINKDNVRIRDYFPPNWKPLSDDRP